MKAIVKTGPGPGLQLREVETPEPGPDEVAIRIAAASICGTDLHIYRWNDWAASRITPPRILGHEFCGHVAERGADVDTVEEGDFVSAESHIVCGRCFQCRTGSAHICQEIRILGIDRDGGFAERIVVPAGNVWSVDERIPTEWASLFDPFGNAVHTVYSVDVRSRRVAVFGCGSIGLFSIAVARAVGAEVVYAVDIAERKLELARAVGADATCDGSVEDPVGWLRDLTADRGGVDVVLEMSGSPRALVQGLQALRDGGEVAVLGIPSSEVEIDVARDVVFKGARIVGVVGRRIWETWYRMQALLTDGSVDLDPIITRTTSFARFEEAFDDVAGGEHGKVIMKPGP